MKVEMSVLEAVDLFKEIQGQPERLFEMIRGDRHHGALSAMLDYLGIPELCRGPAFFQNSRAHPLDIHRGEVL